MAPSLTMIALYSRKIATILIICFSGASALAADAGHIIFAVGEVRVQQQVVEFGHTVQVGDQLETGPTGYLYLKTIDNGFLILRPSSSARILAYHIDTADASKSRFKIELLQGVARSISGQAVKNARQNFRFNTPVGAIGVRGTDFTAYSSRDITNITVTSGGVVVSGFVGGCSPAGHGPCEGNLSRELFSNQNGQILQITRSQAVPQLLRGNAQSPDQNAPPRPDEPTARNSTTTSRNIVIDDNLSLLMATPFAPANSVPPANAPKPEGQPQFMWGRWQPLLGQQPEIDIGKLQARYTLLAMTGNYVLMRDKNVLWHPPQQPVASFALRQYQAVILDEVANHTAVANIQNGQLNLNFANATFSTQFDLVSKDERFALQAQGTITQDGLLAGVSQFTAPTNMVVRGAVGSGTEPSATYLFQSRLDDRRVASGATVWGK